LLWEAYKKKFSFRRVEVKRLAVIKEERMLKLSDAEVENGWIEREEKFCVVSIKVVAQGE